MLFQETAENQNQSVRLDTLPNNAARCPRPGRFCFGYYLFASVSKHWLVQSENKRVLDPTLDPTCCFQFPKIPFEMLPMTLAALVSALRVRLA